MNYLKYSLAGLLLLFSSNVFAKDLLSYQLPDNQWQIKTLPAEPPGNTNTVKAIFKELLAETYEEKWVLYSYGLAGYINWHTATLKPILVNPTNKHKWQYEGNSPCNC